MNPAAKKKRRKKGVKEKKINSEAQSDPVVSMRLPLKHFFFFRKKHLSGGGMRPNYSQSLLILPVQSPHGAEAGGDGGAGLAAGTRRHLALTFCLRPVSFESWLVFIKPVSEAQVPQFLTNYQPPTVSLLDLLYIVGLLMASFLPIRRSVCDAAIE